MKTIDKVKELCDQLLEELGEMEGETSMEEKESVNRLLHDIGFYSNKVSIMNCYTTKRR